MQMKHKKILLVLALVLAFVLAGCGAEESPYSVNDSQGYTVSVKYDANGGIFTTNTSVMVDSYDITQVPQAGGVASIALLPYVLLTEDLSAISVTPLAVILLLVAGIVHTGFTYWLYFGSMEHLPSHTVALLSYIDPILAIILSVLLLREPMTLASAIGAVLILGAAYVSEK